MSGEYQTLMRLVGLSVRDPSEAARQLTARQFERSTLWMALLLVSILSVLLLALSNLLFPVAMPEGVVPMTPLTYGIVVAASLVMMVFALHWTGRMMGGKGAFDQTMVIVIWLQVVALFVQLAQIVAMAILPALSGLVSLAGVFVLLWCLINFINVVQGFDSLVKSAVTFFVGLIGIGFGLAIILMMIGVTVQAGI